MTIQVAVRLPEELLARLDSGIAAGRYASRAAAIRTAIDVLLRAEREREIAAEYARAYGEAPQEDWIGEAGLALMAEVIATEEMAGDGEGAG